MARCWCEDGSAALDCCLRTNACELALSPNVLPCSEFRHSRVYAPSLFHVQESQFLTEDAIAQAREATGARIAKGADSLCAAAVNARRCEHGAL
eukprot:3096259-Pleurochrysis_carterae.AAC.1